MRILLVGSTGFLGSYIGHALSEAGHEVVGTTRSEPNNEFTRNLDLFNISETRLLLSEVAPDVLINCAWVTRHDSYLSHGINRAYMAAEKMLFDACVQLPLEHYISLGTSMEHASSNQSIHRESKNLPKTSLYAETKSETLNYVNQRADESEINWNWVRIFQPYGKGLDKMRFLPRIISSLKSETAFHINNPHELRDWISARDIGIAINKLVLHRHSGVVELGTKVATSNIELAQKVSQILKVDNDVLTFSMEGTSNALVAPNCEILESIDWRPQDTLDDGLKWMMGVD